MLKQILLCTALLAPSAALAADQAPGDRSDVSEKNICDDIGVNMTKCLNASSVCKWDVDDHRCESISPAATTCAYSSPSTCNSDAHCVWDSVEGRCERL